MADSSSAADATSLDSATQVPDTTGADDPIQTTCNVSDRFEAVDMGKVIVADMIDEIPTGSAIADNTSYRLADGRIRLYFIASYHSSQPPTPDNGSPANGVHSAISTDGYTFELETGLRIPEPAGHPKLFQLPSGQIRMFHLVTDGLGSQVSDDGLTFTEEDGIRLASSDAGMERVGGMSVVSLPEGGYRGYFSNLGIPGQPPKDTVTQIRTATSSDMMDFVVEDGVRIGDDALGVTSKSRQPFALTRADGCITLFYYRVETPPSKIYYATSLDGLTFETEYRLGINGYDGAEAGPNIQQLSDGSYVMYFDANDDTDKWHVRVANLKMTAATE